MVQEFREDGEQGHGLGYSAWLGEWKGENRLERIDLRGYF